MTVSDQESAEFVFIKYSKSAPPLDKTNIVLNCRNLRWATDDKLDHLFKYGQVSSETIVVGK